MLKKGYRMFLCGWLFIHLLLVNTTVIVYAEKKSIEKNPFSYIKQNDLTTDSTLRETAVSFYELLMSIGIIGIMCTIIICSIKIMFPKHGQTKADAKNHLLVKCAISIMIFAFTFIIGLANAIAKSLI